MVNSQAYEGRVTSVISMEKNLHRSRCSIELAATTRTAICSQLAYQVGNMKMDKADCPLETS